MAQGEWDERISAAAVPVSDARNAVIATVAVWGASTRVTPARLPDLIVAAREAAKAISLRLGWTGDPTKRPGIVPLVKQDDEEERERLADEGDDEAAS